MALSKLHYIPAVQNKNQANKQENKKRDTERVQKNPSDYYLGMHLVFKIDSRKYLDWEDIQRFGPKTRNAELRNNHRWSRCSLQEKKCRSHSPCPNLTHIIQLLPRSTEFLGLPGEHWLFPAGSVLPAPPGDQHCVGGDQGEEEGIKLAFNFAGCGKINDKWSNS